MSGRIPREMSPCLSLGARKGSEKNWPRSPRLIPKSRSSLESPSRMRNLFVPICPTPPRSWIFTMMRPVRGLWRLINELGSAGVMLELDEVGRSCFHMSLNDDSVLCSETRRPDGAVGLGLGGSSGSEG